MTLGSCWWRVASVVVLCGVACLMPRNGAAAAPGGTVAAFDPQLAALLLENGYTRNIVQVGGRQALRASQRNYSNQTWSRDLDYAMGGYSYVLDDMRVLRDNLELFLAATDQNGVVPETIDVGTNAGINREAWDSMPNAIAASYVYAAKTGDRGWVGAQLATLERITGWIQALDSNGDGLPDRDIFPYGYNDATRNSVMHTYALAKFYAAYRQMAALERMVGRNGQRYDDLASRLRAAFLLPENLGGYWPAGQTWPLAWRKGDGTVLRLLETFGVFQAAVDDLIGPEDGWRYRDLMATLHDALPALIKGPTPTKFTLGGYPTSVRRDMVPASLNWVLDSASPWVAGIHAIAVDQAGYPDDAAAIMDAYRQMALATDPPVMEGAAGPEGRYGPGDSNDRGRTWDNAAWFLAVYEGHYGLQMTPEALVVAPRPFRQIAGDRVDNFAYQGAHLTLELDAARRIYYLRSDGAVKVRLRPVGDAAGVAVDGVERGPEWIGTLGPGQRVTVQSIGYTSKRADPAFEQVWKRADAPIVQGTASRSWLWGPGPFRATVEPYAESPEGERLVDYYDKARMEITRPGGDRSSKYFVTNGLLVKELVSGQMQVGDASFVPAAGSDVPVAGDPTTDNPSPAYRVFQPYTTLNLDHRAESRVGLTVNATIDQAGNLGTTAGWNVPPVRIVKYEATLGHNVPDVIWTFLQNQPDDWLYAFGYPISEPYWMRARVGGVEQPVLIQLFERRTVTYTPANPAAFQVEMGNVGQHYHQWRYGFRPWESAGRVY